MIIKLLQDAVINDQFRIKGEVVSVSNPRWIRHEIIKSNAQIQLGKNEVKGKIESLKNDSIKQDAIYIKS